MNIAFMDVSNMSPATQLFYLLVIFGVIGALSYRWYSKLVIAREEEVAKREEEK